MIVMIHLMNSTVQTVHHTLLNVTTINAYLGDWRVMDMTTAETTVMKQTVLVPWTGFSVSPTIDALIAVIYVTETMTAVTRVMKLNVDCVEASDLSNAVSMTDAFQQTSCVMVTMIVATLPTSNTAQVVRPSLLHAITVIAYQEEWRAMDTTIAETGVTKRTVLVHQTSSSVHPTIDASFVVIYVTETMTVVTTVTSATVANVHPVNFDAG